MIESWLAARSRLEWPDFLFFSSFFQEVASERAREGKNGQDKGERQLRSICSLDEIDLGEGGAS